MGDADKLEDFAVFDMCRDCEGAGKKKLFTSFDVCPTCEGSGWVPKGEGWTYEQWVIHRIGKRTAARKYYE